jgi:hypothetical protein
MTHIKFVESLKVEVTSQTFVGKPFNLRFGCRLLSRMPRRDEAVMFESDSEIDLTTLLNL